MTPALNFPPELLLKAQGMRVAFFDIDGVLTDGGLFMSDQGESLKRFNILDGLGIKLLQKAGITPAVITGRDSKALRGRLSALGVTHAHFGTEDKRPAAEQTLKTLGLEWHQAAAIGDDWLNSDATLKLTPAADTYMSTAQYHPSPSCEIRGFPYFASASSISSRVAASSRITLRSTRPFAAIAVSLRFVVCTPLTSRYLQRWASLQYLFQRPVFLVENCGNHS